MNRKEPRRRRCRGGDGEGASEAGGGLVEVEAGEGGAGPYGLCTVAEHALPRAKSPPFLAQRRYVGEAGDPERYGPTTDVLSGPTWRRDTVRYGRGVWSGPSAGQLGVAGEPHRPEAGDGRTEDTCHHVS